MTRPSETVLCQDSQIRVTDSTIKYPINQDITLFTTRHYSDPSLVRPLTLLVCRVSTPWLLTDPQFQNWRISTNHVTKGHSTLWISLGRNKPKPWRAVFSENFYCFFHVRDWDFQCWRIGCESPATMDHIRVIDLSVSIIWSSLDVCGYSAWQILSASF